MMRRIEPGLQRRCVLAGGDDYELLFAAPAGQRQAVETVSRECCIAITRIGLLTAEPGLRLVGDEQGIDATLHGFDHFAGAAEA
jgi:thiamine-monophosphate kinase